MRKYQQRQILDLLQTIGQAQSVGLYADCQEGALDIGGYIENIEGEGTLAVGLLEEYCELLFKANNGEIGDTQLQKHLAKVEDCVRQELTPNRTEIAFLSYKASMSDSIESIYLAAKANPSCDAYWIPIPFYERKPDGSFGAMHFEGADRYGANIECTDWRQYDIDVRRPDAIFTFAPYDEGNYITSVHPDFYCSRLRGLTDLLVYVPYFVVMDNVHGYICTVAGCEYAHKVVVQSEQIRQQYIHYCKEAYGDRISKPEDKFVALGSPKFDKVINAKREDSELPDDWRKIIGEQKVVLYNTTVTAILANNEQYLKKLRHVLKTFRNREDIVLWWRPHPLSEQTYASMRPHLAGEYRQIVSEYQRGGWGIYDDSADLHRAIAWTDVYYGDWSSLVTLYGVTGKPVVIQDVYHTENDVLLRFADFAVDDEGNAWAFELFNDGLFKLDFGNNSAKLMAKSGNTPLHKGKPAQTHRYVAIRCAGDEVICFPYFLDKIFIYNRLSSETKEIAISREYLYPSDYNNGFALCLSRQYKNKIYIFGSYTKAILVFDTATRSVGYHTSFFDCIGLLTNDCKTIKYPVYVSECSGDGAITVLMRNCRHLVSYSLLTQGVEIVASNPVLEKCVRADFDGSDYWLISEDVSKLLRWNPVSDEIAEYNLPDSNTASMQIENVFSGLSDCGDYILLFPGFGEKVLKFEKNTGLFGEHDKLPEPAGLNNTVYKYDTPKCVDGKVYAFSRYDYTVHKLDKLTQEVVSYKFRMSDDESSVYSDVFYGNLYAVVEESGFGNITQHFACSMNEDSKTNSGRQISFLENSANKDGTAGRTIYEFVNGAVLK